MVEVSFEVFWTCFAMGCIGSLLLTEVLCNRFGTMKGAILSLLVLIVVIAFVMAVKGFVL